jgi:uncharacterized membrane protein YfcA
MLSMDIVFALLVLLIALLAGLFGSLLAIGLDVDIKVAISTSLLGMVANSAMGTTNYLRKGLTNVRLGLIMNVATVSGAIIGALVAAFIYKEILLGLFAIILILAAVFMLVFRGRDEQRELPSEGGSQLSGGYHDESIDGKVSYEVVGLKKGMLAGFTAGNLSGILGIGGGIVSVPAMNIWMKAPMKAAAATSNFMLGFTALAGALIYYLYGHVSVIIAAFVVMGFLVGAGTGSRLAPRIRSEVLNRSFAVVLVAAAILMFLRALGIYVLT